MSPSTTPRLVAAALVGCATVAGVIGTRSIADTRLAAAKVPFRSVAPKPVDAAVAEHDPTWRLGRMLFSDPSLSASGHTACAICHQPGHGWSNSESRAIGDNGQPLAFKSPTLLDTGTLDRFGWTGRFASMAAVTKFAITSPTNMGLPLAEATRRLQHNPVYAAPFKAAFGSEGIDDARILQALGAYAGSLRADTSFDHWVDGDAGAIDDDAKRGFAIFTGKGQCAACHSGPSLTDGSYHDIGSSTDDLGRGKFFKTSVKLQYAFKTPSLRGVADRAPYLHDGSRTTLEDVIDLYDRGGIERPSRADGIRPLHLSAQEKSDLVAFLKTLSGETRYAPAR